jgi:hypothetical protein
MTLKDFKDYIESFPKKTEFKYGISKPFSWRGSYDEVAFEIVEYPMVKEQVLEHIELAYTETFNGYKGGDFVYGDNTTVNFEESYFHCSGGEYTLRMIQLIEGVEKVEQEKKLVKLAFKQKQ